MSEVSTVQTTKPDNSGGYIPGAEHQSIRPVIPIDTAKITQAYEQFLTNLKKSDPDLFKEKDDPRLFKKQIEFLAAEAKKQLEANMPGYTTFMDEMELAAIAYAALDNQPARMPLGPSSGCIVFAPPLINTDPNHIIVGGTGFSESFLNPLPGSKEDWRRLFGVHEGQHCRQQGVALPIDHPERPLAVLKNETNADIAALHVMRNEGKTDIVKTWLDFRVVSAIFAGDVTHASAFFLDKNGNKIAEPTQEKLDAIKSVKDTMLTTVAEKLGITKDQANELMTKDHKTFITTLEAAVKNGEVKTNNPDVLNFTKMYVDSYKSLINLDAPSPATLEGGFLRLQDLMKRAQEYLPKDAAPAAPATKDVNEAPAQLKSSAIESTPMAQSLSGRYDYLAAELPNIVANPKTGIILDTNDWKLKIDGRSPGEAFALKADISLVAAQEEIALKAQLDSLQTMQITKSAPSVALGLA